MNIEINKYQATEILNMIHGWNSEDEEMLGEDFVEGYIGGAKSFLNILNIREEDLTKILEK